MTNNKTITIFLEPPAAPEVGIHNTVWSIASFLTEKSHPCKIKCEPIGKHYTISVSNSECESIKDILPPEYKQWVMKEEIEN